MPQYKTKAAFRNSLWENLGGSSQQALGMVVQKKQQDKQMQEAIQKMLLEASLKDMQLKKGANLSGMDTTKGIGGILGQIPSNFERKPVTPTTSISISERPYTEMIKARQIASRTPAEHGKAGRATKVGGNILGIPTGWGFGSKWQVSPEAQQEKAEAETILGNPYKTTKHVSYKGDVIDTTGQVLNTSTENEQLISEAMTDNPDKTREEVIAALTQQGYLK